MGVHVFPILNAPPTSLPTHPTGSSQRTSPKHPVSCIEPGLAIHFTYDNLHKMEICLGAAVMVSRAGQCWEATLSLLGKANICYFPGAKWSSQKLG